MNVLKIFRLPGAAVWQNQSFRRYSGNMIWLSAERVVRIIIGLTVGIYVARELGPYKYGMLSYVQNFCIICSIFGNFVAEVVAVQRLVKYPARRNEILGSCFRVRLIALLPVAVFTIIGIMIQQDSPELIRLIILMSTTNIWLLFSGAEFFFQAGVYGKYVAIAQIIAHIIGSLGRGTCAYLKADLIWFVAFESFFALIYIILYLVFYRKLCGESVCRWKFSSHECRILLRRSWPIILAGMGGMVYAKADQLFLKELTDLTEVGFYAVANRMTELFYTIPTIIGVTLFPAIVKYHTQDSALYQERIRILYCGMFYGGLTSVLVLNLLAPGVIDLLYGGKYNQAVEIFHLYSWNILFMFIATANAKVMVLQRCQNYQLIFSLLGVGINLTLNTVLIPRYAAQGAAAASVINGGVIFLILPICFRATRNIGWNILAAPNFMPALRLLAHWLK